MDSLDAQFAAAMVPDRYRVLGRVLQAPSIGHLLVLTKLRSPYIVAGPLPPTAEDLAAAVAILSYPWPLVLERLYSFRLRLRIMRLGIRAWWDIRSKVTWRRYIDDLITGPRMWAGGGSARTLEVPWWLHVQTELMRALGMSTAEVMAMPVAEALWRFRAVQEMEGTASFVTPEEEEIMEEAEASEGSAAADDPEEPTEPPKEEG